uniref:non-specific serine/threonine protein kinase n=1 Tax=Hucho hucho TaxID=62062 RepID=A0A4W5NZT0_9TELE
QPQTFLPVRYQYFHTFLSDIAAQLQSVGFRRFESNGSPRNKVVSAATCQEIQVNNNKALDSVWPVLTPSKDRLWDTWSVCYFWFSKCTIEYWLCSACNWHSNKTVFPVPLQAGSSSKAILRPMSQELVPAGPLNMKQEKEEQIALNGLVFWGRVCPTQRDQGVPFTANVPLLHGAQEEYTDVLSDSTLRAWATSILCSCYPYTLHQYLEVNMSSRRENGCPQLVITDFGCCLAQKDPSIRAVATAVPSQGVVINYTKADARAVSAISSEIFGQANLFFGAGGLDSRSFQEKQLPALPASVCADMQLGASGSLVLRTLGHARVSANMLHLSLWGRRALANQDSAGMKTLADWLLCQSAVVLLRGSTVQRCFMSNVDLEDLRLGWKWNRQVTL